MINIDDYSKFLNAEFKSVLAPDISISIHDEFYYNDQASLNVTIKVLPGQIQCGVVQYPAELIIEVNECFTTEVKEFLNEFVIDHNETLITLGGHTFKQFYATPNVIGTFQDKGLTKNTAMSVSVSLISYNNVLCLEKFTLTSVESSKSTIIRPISFVSSYLVDTNATGSIFDQHTRSIGETVANTYSITCVPKEEEIFIELIELMLKNAKPNAKFKVLLEFSNGKDKILTVIEVNTILQSGNYSQQSNGLPLMELTFMRGEEV